MYFTEQGRCKCSASLRTQPPRKDKNSHFVRPHCLRCGLLLHMSQVAWSVCLCVCWSHGRAVQKRLNRSRCRLRLTLVGSRKYVLDGGRHHPHGKGNFRDWLAHGKTLGASSVLYAAKGTIQASVTVPQRYCCSRLQCSQLVGVTLQFLHSPLQCGLLSKLILWPLVWNRCHFRFSVLLLPTP